MFNKDPLQDTWLNMDYLSPQGIAGMFNTPKDTSIPGAGYGATQGYLEGVAANQAMDMLDLQKAMQGQDYVKTAIDMSEGRQKFPYELERLQLTNQGLQGQNQAGQIDRQIKERSLQGLNQEDQFTKFNFLGQHADSIHQATKYGVTGQLAAIKQMRDNFAKAFPQDQATLKEIDELMANPDPTAVEGLLQSLRQYQQMSPWLERQNVGKSALLKQEYGERRGMQDKEIASNEKIADERNRVQLQIAQINAAAQSAQTRATRAGLLSEAIEALSIDKDKRTPRQQALAENADKLMAPQVVSTEMRLDPERIEQGAAADVVGALKGAKKAGQPDNFDDQMKRQIEADGYAYEPDKYEYRYDSDGNLQRRKK